MNKWDERYSELKFSAYGKEPNDFLKEATKELKPKSKILSIADGQGRNGVYLASLGHDVTSMDSSEVGVACSTLLAEEKGVELETIQADLNDFDMGEEKWDAIVSIFCHLPNDLREKVHNKIAKGLKKGGLFILEAYNPDQLDMPGKGGPKDIELLFTTEMMAKDFSEFELITNQNTVRKITEGVLHDGESSTVQLLARK